MLAYLLLGRGVFRVTQYGAALALLGIWGEARYGHFAAALGAVLWLTAITSVGTEKAALKLLARAQRTRQSLLNSFLLLACAVPVAPSLLFAVAVASGWTEPAALYAGAAALAASLGANTLLVGLLRVSGFPSADVRNFLLLAASYAGLTALAGVGLIGPVTYLAIQLVAVLALNLAMVRRLGGLNLRLVVRGRLARVFGRTVVLMGGTELCAHAAPSILFVELAFTRWSGQSGWLYLGDLLWAAGLNLFFYVLRVYQPQTSQRLAGSGAAAGRVRARQLARLATLASVGWFAGIAFLLALTDLAATSSGLGLLLVLGAILVSRVPVFVLVNLAAYLLENGDDRALGYSAVASVCGLVGLAAVGLLTIPAYGALGALAALGVMDLVQATALLVLTRRGANRAPRPAQARSSATA